jgi:glycosyltransferase involved in cell wall biosynthesis
MKFSIITVAYNSSATIADTMRSVCEQSFPDIEHIIIDGASTDGTPQLALAEMRSGGVLVSEPDRGLYDAMNKGIAMASGDIIGILNSDDLYAHCDVLQIVAEQFSQHGVQAILSDVGFFRDDSSYKITRRYNSGYFHPRRLGWGWMPAHPGMFMLRESYIDAGEFRTDYKIAADFEFIARTFVKQNIRYRYINEVTVLMRLGGRSTSGFRANITINREVLRACRENGIYSNWAMLACKYPRKFLENFA